MQPAFYTKTRTATGQTERDIIRTAHALGYELMRFNGWTNADLGSVSNHGPHYEQAALNHKILMEIIDACTITFEDGTYDAPHILADRQDGHD